MEIKITPNKRFTFIGKTRSGKSFLAWYFLKKFSSRDKDLQIVFIDPKHEKSHFGNGKTLDAPKLVTKYQSRIRFQIFQSYTWNDELDHMVDELLKRGNAIVVLDELGGIADSTVIPTGILRLWTQGGGKGVGAWSMLQQPRRVPRIIKSQTELFFMFKINDEDDRKAMLSYIPDKNILKKIPKYYFWIYQDDMDFAILAKPIDIPDFKSKR